MSSRFENTALTYREPESRVGRRCASTQLARGHAEIGAGAARSLPKSDSQRGPRFPGSGEIARGTALQGREQLVHRGTFLATPALGASSAFFVRMFAPRVWAPSARLRPCAVRSASRLTRRELVVGAAA
jgi:hypothetical protein